MPNKPRRRVMQISKPLDLLASAAKEEAQHALALAQETDQKAATKSKALHLLASAAKEEAQHARARAQEAEKGGGGVQGRGAESA